MLNLPLPLLLLFVISYRGPFAGYYSEWRWCCECFYMQSVHLKNGNDSVAGAKPLTSAVESRSDSESRRLGTSASNKKRDDPDWVMDAISGFIFIFQLQIP